MNKEPAVLINAVVGLLTAIVGTLVAFGIDVSPDQEKALTTLAIAIGSLVALAGPVIRQFVTPVEKAEGKIKEAYYADPAVDPIPKLTEPIVTKGGV